MYVWEFGEPRVSDRGNDLSLLHVRSGADDQAAFFQMAILRRQTVCVFYDCGVSTFLSGEVLLRLYTIIDAIGDAISGPDDRALGDRDDWRRRIELLERAHANIPAVVPLVRRLPAERIENLIAHIDVRH